MDDFSNVFNVKKLGRMFACVQTSPISFVARGTFPRATKEIGDVCTQASGMFKILEKWKILDLPGSSKNKI